MGFVEIRDASLPLDESTLKSVGSSSHEEQKDPINVEDGGSFPPSKPNFQGKEEPPEEFEIDDKYELLDLIWFPVCAAIDKSTGELVAIKKIKKVTSSKTQGGRVFRELQILGEYCHPFMLKLKEVMVPADKNNFDEIYVVMEIMQRNLIQYLETIIEDDGPKKVSNFNIKLIMNQLFRGLQYMHSSGLLHRDIKPGNVVMNGIRVKFCDFGHSRQKSDEMSRYIGTPCYSPPEYFLNTGQPYYKYGASADIWSLGCLFSDLLHPEQDHILDIDNSCSELINLQKIAKIIPVPEYIEELYYFIEDVDMLLFATDELPHTPSQPLTAIFSDVEDKSAVDLLQKMLVFNPNKRISVEEALKHEYMADISVEVLAKELNLDNSEVEQLKNWSPCKYIVNNVESEGEEELAEKLYELCLNFKVGDK